MGNGSLFAVQHRDHASIFILNIIKDADVPQIQCFLYDLVAVDPLRTVSVGGFDVAPVNGLALHIPLSGVLREMDLDIPLHIVWRPEQLKHELPHILFR